MFLFSCLLISWLLYSCPVCAASIAGPSVRVHVWLSPRLQFLLFGSCSVLLAYSMLWQSESLSGRESSSPRCHRRTASSVWQAAHCTVHRGQPPLHRHQPVSTLVEGSGLWALLQREQAHLPAGQPASTGGDTRAKRAVSEVWVGTPVPVDCPAAMVGPSFRSCRVSPPRGVDQCLGVVLRSGLELRCRKPTCPPLGGPPGPRSTTNGS